MRSHTSRREPIRPVHVAARDNVIVNRLNKTKVEKEVDHEQERQDRLREEGRRKKAEAAEQVGARFPEAIHPFVRH
jgi:hypothetical protein